MFGVLVNATGINSHISGRIERLETKWLLWQKVWVVMPIIKIFSVR